MAKITKVVTVCDGCQSETETAGFRVGVTTGNTRSLDLCPACQGRPFGEIVGAVGHLRARTRGSNARPAVASMEQIEAAAKAAEEAKAPAKRAARKTAQVKG